jgi:hypothetical protein
MPWLPTACLQKGTLRETISVTSRTEGRLASPTRRGCERLTLFRQIVSDQEMRKSGLHLILLRYDQKSHPQLVQHAAVRQSNKSGCPLSEEAKPSNGLNRRLGGNGKWDILLFRGRASPCFLGLGLIDLPLRALSHSPISFRGQPGRSSIARVERYTCSSKLARYLSRDGD